MVQTLFVNKLNESIWIGYFKYIDKVKCKIYITNQHKIWNWENVNKKPNLKLCFLLLCFPRKNWTHASIRSAFGPSLHFFHTKWPFKNRISIFQPQSIVSATAIGEHRSVHISASYRNNKKKSSGNPEDEVLVHKTNQRSTNKKTFLERKIKPKRTVWGVIDVYRFITIEKLASLMKKSIGKLRFLYFVCSLCVCAHMNGIIQFWNIVDLLCSAQKQNI